MAAADKTGYEGIHSDEPQKGEGKRKWAVTLIAGWMGRSQFGAQVNLNGAPVGILSLPTEDDYRWLKRVLEEGRVEP